MQTIAGMLPRVNSYSWKIRRNGDGCKWHADVIAHTGTGITKLYWSTPPLNLRTNAERAAKQLVERLNAQLGYTPAH